MGRAIALPMLTVRAVRVAEPCPTDWRAMDGEGDRVRHCRLCGLDVTNLSAMTEAEAAAFLAAPSPASGGRRCVAYVPAADGGPATIDYRRTDPGRRRVGWRVATAFGAIAAVAVGYVRYVMTGNAPPQVLGGITVRPMIAGEIGRAPVAPGVVGDVSVPTSGSRVATGGVAPGGDPRRSD